MPDTPHHNVNLYYLLRREMERFVYFFYLSIYLMVSTAVSISWFYSYMNNIILLRMDVYVILILLYTKKYTYIYEVGLFLDCL